MAALGGTVLTLADHAKRLDPDGSTAQIVEMLSMNNDVLQDANFIEGNLITGNRSTVRTGLPTVTWRQLNQGVAPSKSTTAQSDDHAALLEAWSETDVKLANLGGDPGAFRMNEASAFIEAMGQEAASTLWYGNAGAAPEEFTGFAPRYNLLAGANGQNIIDGGGTDASDNTSIWLVTWGPGAASMMFPKGSKAGLQHFDHGQETKEVSAGIGGALMRVYRDQFTWDLGLTVKDWRSVVRVANLDVSAIIANSGAATIVDLLTKATWRPPGAGGRQVFYMNRTVGQFLDIQARAQVSTGGQLGYTEWEGKRVLSFRGIPIRISDAILNTEARVV